MRTVHETEALRPSDPIPKSMQPKLSARRLKIILKPSQPFSEQPHAYPTNGVSNGHIPQDWTSSCPPELGFTPEEEAKGPKELYRYLRRELVWAEEETEILKRQAEEMEAIRKKEWMEKEILLDQVMKNEISYHERRAEVLASQAKLLHAEETRAAAAATSGPTLGFDPSGPPSFQVPEYNREPPAQPGVSTFATIKEQPMEDQNEAAAVLASMSQT